MDIVQLKFTKYLHLVCISIEGKFKNADLFGKNLNTLSYLDTLAKPILFVNVSDGRPFSSFTYVIDTILHNIDIS